MVTRHGSERTVEREATFLFADLAGFTALTDAHGDERAADLAGDFVAATGALLPDYEADYVKQIGDAVMLRGRDPGRAVRLGLCLVREIGGRHGFPAIRVGMHTGSAVERAGDWFGGTVNLAARVAGAAGGREVLVSGDTVRAAGTLEDVELEARGSHELRNVARPVALYAAVRKAERGAGELPIDPVCRMAVEPSRRAGVLVRRGVEYQFCSLECVAAFAAEPERFGRHG